MYKKIFLSNLRVLFLALSCFVIPLSISLILIAKGNISRLSASSALLFIIAIYLLLKKIRLSYVLAMLMLAISLLTISILKLPQLKNKAESKFQSIFFQDPPPGSNLCNLVTEIDFLQLGSFVIPLLDPYLTFDKSMHLRRMLLNIYNELESDDEFANTSSALCSCYREIIGLPNRYFHLFSYIPNQAESKPMPVLLFLHGSLGNFKGYLWILRELAERDNIAIVAPTFGAGNWDNEDGIEAINLAMQYIRNNKELDASRITFAALSNGGIGAGKFIKKNPIDVQGLVLLSAVTWPNLDSPNDLVQFWGNKPILILHGNNDERIPSYILNNLYNQYMSFGMKVTAHFFNNEDHFVFFSKRKETIEIISGWGNSQKLW
jgi:predicted esterase